jgi:hypothetical protein
MGLTFEQKFILLQIYNSDECKKHRNRDKIVVEKAANLKYNLSENGIDIGETQIKISEKGFRNILQAWNDRSTFLKYNRYKLFLIKL